MEPTPIPTYLNTLPLDALAIVGKFNEDTVRREMEEKYKPRLGISVINRSLSFYHGVSPHPTFTVSVSWPLEISPGDSTLLFFKEILSGRISVKEAAQFCTDEVYHILNLNHLVHLGVNETGLYILIFSNTIDDDIKTSDIRYRVDESLYPQMLEWLISLENSVTRHRDRCAEMSLARDVFNADA